MLGSVKDFGVFFLERSRPFTHSGVPSKRKELEN